MSFLDSGQGPQHCQNELCDLAASFHSFQLRFFASPFSCTCSFVHLMSWALNKKSLFLPHQACDCFDPDFFLSNYSNSPVVLILIFPVGGLTVPATEAKF